MRKQLDGHTKTSENIMTKDIIELNGNHPVRIYFDQFHIILVPQSIMPRIEIYNNNGRILTEEFADNPLIVLDEPRKVNGKSFNLVDATTRNLEEALAWIRMKAGMDDFR